MNVPPDFASTADSLFAFGSELAADLPPVRCGGREGRWVMCPCPITGRPHALIARPGTLSG